MIEHQILETNLQGNVQQLEGRINNQILGIKKVKSLNLRVWLLIPPYIINLNSNVEEVVRIKEMITKIDSPIPIP